MDIGTHKKVRYCHLWRLGQGSLTRVLTSEAQPYGPETRVLVERHHGTRALSHGKEVEGGTHMEGSPSLEKERHISQKLTTPQQRPTAYTGVLGFQAHKVKRVNDECQASSSGRVLQIAARARATGLGRRPGPALLPR